MKGLEWLDGLTEWLDSLLLRYRLWCALLFELPGVFLAAVFIEYWVFGVLVLLFSATVSNIDEAGRNAAVCLFLLFAFFQLKTGWSYRTHPKHIVNMALRARDGDKSGKPGDFSFNVYWMRYCLFGVVRIGREMSGKHFADILLNRLKVKQTEHRKSPDGSDAQSASSCDIPLRAMLKGIEMQMAHELAYRSENEPACPSVHFCGKIIAAMETEPIHVGALVDLIVEQFLSLDPNIIHDLGARTKVRSLNLIEQRMKWIYVGGLVVGVMTPLAQVLAILY